MPKLLVLYVFHIFNERVKHFIDNCIFEDDNVDFVIISNDKSNIFEVPNYVMTLHRDNIGYDFGGWSEALLTKETLLNKYLYERYDHFIFVNSSVMGPFLPSYYKGKWTDIYVNGLQNNVKLFGSTINTDPCIHVQSYIFSMNKETLSYLIGCEIFSVSNYAKTFHETIFNNEILMSTKIIENGWNIDSLLKIYKGVDFTFKTKKKEEYNIAFLDDVMYPQFRNNIWNEYELVFIKGNRVQV